ncbi:MAG: hypothetical protein HBSIN02_05280 [Bacteroidia bacterium]|nr:MAG: hypothetical protein HBSIN02_05280 [Bacteroidia bacterium]
MTLRIRGCCTILLCSLGVFHPPPLAAQPASPRLLADKSDIERAREWVRDHPWYRSIIESHKRVCDEFIKRPVYVSPIKQVYEYKMYTCPKHDVELVYDETEPFRHRCRKDSTEVYSGGKYDMAWAGWYNRLLASRLVWLGILYQIYQNDAYAEAGRKILTKFADLYLSYPTSNTILGPAHVFFGTLSESFWGVDMAYGYDLLSPYAKFTAAERKKIKEKLFYPLAKITQQFPESASNRQLWYNNVSAAVGFLYNDQELIDFALHGKYGFFWQLGSALPESGFWPEWSGYHFVALRGMIHLAEMARHNGIDLYRVQVAGRSMKSMFDAPFEIILPNYEFPRMKDSGGGNILEYAPYYEVGYAEYRDPKYLALLNKTNVLRGTQVVGETSGREEAQSPVTIFNLIPELPPSSVTFIPEHSVNLKGNGFAALRNGMGRDARLLYLDYGIMGGEHGHPDRLQIGYYARGRNWIVDPLNESYFNPNLQLWYRQTVAHVTPVLDQTSQTWTNGYGVFFDALPSVQIASGASASVYPGSLIRRTLIQVGEYFLDLVDIEGPDKRIIDWPLQSFGSLELSGVHLKAEPHDLFGHEPGIPGYDQLREIRSAQADGSWSGVFSVRNECLMVHAIPEEGTRLFQAIAPTIGGFYKQMVSEPKPMAILISRRFADTTRFAHVLHAYADVPFVKTVLKPAEDTYEVVHRAGTDRIFADVRESRYSILRVQNEAVALAAGFNVKEIRRGNIPIVASDITLPSVECRWEDSRLIVNTEADFVSLRILVQGATEVILNGTASRVKIDNGYAVLRQTETPVLDLSAAGKNLFQGRTNAIPVSLWNPTKDTVQGALTIRLQDDWDERVRSQMEWWGGVVNLLPLNKGTVRRIISPAIFPVDHRWLSGRRSGLITLAPGEHKNASLEVSVPHDAPPVNSEAEIGFGNISERLRFTVSPPLTVELRVPNGSPLRFVLKATNHTAEPISARLAVDAHRAWTIEGDSRHDLLLGPHETKKIEIPVRLSGWSEKNQFYPVRISVSAGEFSTVVEQDLYAGIAHLANEPPALDGTWRGWNCSVPMTIDLPTQVHKLLLGNQPWGGPLDLSAQVYVMYDREYLYVGADVKDQVTVTNWNFPAMSYPWDTDCMEVVLDTRMGEDQGSDPPTPGLYRHLSLAEFRKTEFPKERWQGAGAGGPLIPKPLLVPNAETFFTRTDSGYVLICRFPLKNLPHDLIRPGSKIGFDVAINDNDGTTYRKNIHIWAGYTANQSWWDMGSMGILVFR